MLVDTNILILFSKGDQKITQQLLGTREELCISRINYIEFLADPKFKAAEKVKAKQFLVENFKIIDTNQRIADQAIDIRSNLPLKLPDAIIIATAQSLKQKILTLDKQIVKAFPKLVIKV